ncbi:MAG: hypothetical protein HN742_33260 [Lentisphaerae bacterium]|jgi:hypothetical protein|nr:hypothetical protein [Lentisphaerota bacterium]MBT5606561.1 hypothetical protein [Lentisphaerota bacterium]MBT7053470.1 hypothetical protein [Lentisphaerota bacterium]MBT7846787.1 hypothetical protein [Lentisphaerota bacterium]
MKHGHRISACALVFLTSAVGALFAAPTVMLDFGNEKSAVAEAFSAVTPASNWSAGGSWGWLQSGDVAAAIQAVDAPVDPTPKLNPHSNRQNRPGVYTNALSQDHVESGDPVDFRVTVPVGEYRAWFVVGASGPGRSSRNRDRVWDIHIASGKAEVDATFAGMYETRVLTMDVVSDGTVDFALSTRNRWLLNALVLAPVGDWEAVHGDVLSRYEQDIYQLPQELLETWKHRPHIDETPVPALSVAERERGLVAYHRSYLSCIWPNTVPLRREIDREVRAFATLGEYEPITFTVLPLRDFPNVRVTFSDLASAGGGKILATSIDVRTVKYMWVKPNYTADGIYYRAPDVLMPHTAPLQLTDGENLRVWATLRVDPKTPDGVYAGQATISSDGVPVHTVGIRVRVVPIVLEKDETLTYALYYRHPYDNASRAPDAFSRRWFRRRAELEHRDLVAHGMNGITLNCWAPAPKDGKWQFTFARLAEKIDLLRDHGMRRPLPVSIPTFATYRKYIDTPIGSHLRGVKVPPQPFFDTITQMVEKIEAERKVRQWPELLYYPVDEPSTSPDSVALMTAVLKAIKRVPGVRTYVTADPAHEQFEPMRPYIDIWCCQPFNPDYEAVVADMEARPGVEYWCYPNHVNGENDHTPVTGSRMTYGFGLWRSGFRTLIPWIYKSEGGNPWNYLDSTYMDFFNRTADDGSPIPVAMYEAYREGIDDGRYITTLQRWIERAKTAGRDDLARKAEADLAYIWDSIDVQIKYKYDGMWDPSAFDVYRWILGQRILELQGALTWR